MSAHAKIAETLRQMAEQIVKFGVPEKKDREAAAEVLLTAARQIDCQSEMLDLRIHCTQAEVPA